jgi:hypothetical protein
MTSIRYTTASLSNFQLLTKALGDYVKQTGIDLTKNSFADKLQLADSPDDILQLLEEQAKAFQKYRDGNRKLKNSLHLAVQVLHAFSGTLGEAVSLVSCKSLIFCMSVHTCPGRSHFPQQKQFLPVLMFSLPYGPSLSS